MTLSAFIAFTTFILPVGAAWAIATYAIVVVLNDDYDKEKKNR